MSDPNEKDKNRQGSSGRPGTKFMERPRSDSEEEQPGGNWKYANPNPKDPKKKDPEKEPKKQSGQGGDEETMGEEV